MTATRMFLVITLISFSVVPVAYAHQVDSEGNYRLEISWMTEPAVSGEANVIELYVSELDPTLEATKQEFDPNKGVTGLRKDIGMELVYKKDTINLHVLEDRDIPGKYYALVNPTIPGYYQLNVLGNIGDTVVSKSMHPTKVENQDYIVFPERLNEEILANQDSIRAELDSLHQQIKDNEEILANQDSIRAELDSLHQQIKDNENSQYSSEIVFTGIGLGITGIAIGIAAIIRTKL